MFATTVGFFVPGTPPSTRWLVAAEPGGHQLIREGRRPAQALAPTS
ncbi:hypothetical protein ABID37_005072 [Aquamicrobium terrae]|uniref:Uncharacterized protein n=1 Tax=Aquamicrobium terrae TaxID=1324945 RepID=A0ABV2N7M8_9HYPH